MGAHESAGPLPPSASCSRLLVLHFLCLSALSSRSTNGCCSTLLIDMPPKVSISRGSLWDSLSPALSYRSPSAWISRSCGITSAIFAAQQIEALHHTKTASRGQPHQPCTSHITNSTLPPSPERRQAHIRLNLTRPSAKPYSSKRPHRSFQFRHSRLHAVINQLHGQLSRRSHDDDAHPHLPAQTGSHRNSCSSFPPSLHIVITFSSLLDRILVPSSHRIGPGHHFSARPDNDMAASLAFT